MKTFPQKKINISTVWPQSAVPSRKFKSTVVNGFIHPSKTFVFCHWSGVFLLRAKITSSVKPAPHASTSDSNFGSSFALPTVWQPDSPSDWRINRFFGKVQTSLVCALGCTCFSVLLHNLFSALLPAPCGTSSGGRAMLLTHKLLPTWSLCCAGLFRLASRFSYGVHPPRLLEDSN